MLFRSNQPINNDMDDGLLTICIAHTMRKVLSLNQSLLMVWLILRCISGDEVNRFLLLCPLSPKFIFYFSDFYYKICMKVI